MKRNRLSRRGKRQEALREQKKLKTYLGRIIRDIERKTGIQGIKGLDEIKRVLEISKRILGQERGDKGKVKENSIKGSDSGYDSAGEKHQLSNRFQVNQ